MQATWQEHYTELAHLVRAWDRRKRIQQMLRWLPWGGLLGLGLGVVLMLLAWAGLPLSVPQALGATVALTLLIIAVLMAFIAFRPRPILESARQFDVQFGLGERISTALELASGTIRTRPDLVIHQVADARAYGQAVDVAQQLPFAVSGRVWAAAGGALLLLLMLVWFVPVETVADAPDSTQQAALEDAAQTVEDITETVAADTNLTESQRDQLLRELQRASENLALSEITPEEAFATLTQVESELQALADQLAQARQQRDEVWQNAAQALAPQALPQDSGAEQLMQAMQQLQQQMGQQSAAEQSATAEQLAQAAETMQAQDPASSQVLQQAADALRENDPAAAQEALQEASQQLQQQQQRAQQQAQTEQSLQQQAQQAQQTAQQVASQSQPSNSQPRESSDSQQGQDGQTQQQQPAQGGESEGSEVGQGESEGGQSEGGATSGESDQTGGSQESASSGQQPDQTGTTGEGQQSGNAPQGDSAAQSGDSPESGDQPGEGGTAGDQPGGAGSEQDTQGQSTPGEAEASNNPDGLGAAEYSPVYAPQQVGGDGGPELFLEQDAEDVPWTQGEFTENPTGDALVPYEQVFSDYSAAAQQALDSDYIPLGLRDVVRDYFTALEPGS